MNKFIFDVDGTLTPSRGKIDPAFAEFFLFFCQQNSVHLVTGSDYDKTVEQLGIDIVNSAASVFNCSGNEIRIKGEVVKKSTWTLPEITRTWLLGKLDESKFTLRTGNHIEDRVGTVNFSVVGRNATLKERKLYVDFDNKTHERETLVSAFNSTFKDLEARIGGETGIDIYERSKDKSQILEYFSSKDKLYFFGDKMSIDGNDYPLARAIQKRNRGVCLEVSNWKFTFETLQFYQEARIAA